MHDLNKEIEVNDKLHQELKIKEKTNQELQKLVIQQSMN